MNTSDKSDKRLSSGLMRKIIFALIGILVGVGVAVIGSCAGWFFGLEPQAVYAIGVLCVCIIWWVASVLPEFVTGLVMAVAFIVLCGVPTEVSFSAFASSTWWLLVAAFGLGFAMQSSGLLSRISNAILRAFPKTFKMQSAGLIAAGTLVGPFIPSLSAKATMLAPLSLSISDALGYKRGGRGASGLFLAMFTGIRNIGPAIISASIIGYGLLATLPQDVVASFDMVHWFLGMLPWFVFVTVLNYLAIILIFTPDRKRTAQQASQTTAQVVSQANSQTVLQAASQVTPQQPPQQPSQRIPHPKSPASPLSTHEKEMAVIMSCCVVLWILEPLHGIGAHIVAITALVTTLACGVVTPKSFRQNVSWESLIFIGCVLGLASVFAYLEIDEWVIELCGPLFASLAENPYLFVAGIGVITVLLRFVIVSEMAYINIFMAFMVPLALSFGISPWVVGVCTYAMVNPWFVLYQNPIYLTAYYATEGKMVRQSVMAKYCVLYMVICLTGLLVSVPYWQWMGLL